MIVDKVGKQSAFVVGKERLRLECKICDMTTTLLTIKNTWQIRELTIDKREKGIFLEFTPEEISSIVRVLDSIIPQFQNLFNIIINGKDLEELNIEGKSLIQKYIKPRRHGYLTYLTEQRRKGKYNRGKVLVMGDGEAGKTSTVRSFSGEAFNPEHLQTIIADRTEVIDVKASTWKKVGSNEQSISIFARDLKYVSASVVQDAQGITSYAMDQQISPVQIPLSEESTSKALRRIMNEESTVEGGTELANFPEVSVAVHLEKIENPPKLTLWDFGGQRIFDALHLLYFSNGAINFLIFDLQKFAADSELESHRLKRWLSSIALHANQGKTLLIGTRAASVSLMELSRIDNVLDDVLADFYMLQLITHAKEDKWFFPVENSLGEENEVYLKPIKEAVMEIICDEESEGVWNKQVEISWMFFMNYVYDQGHNVCSYSFLEQQGLEFGFSSQDIIGMLDFFHESGALLDYSSTAKSKTDLSVVIRPLWLLKALGNLIMVLERSDLKKMAREKHDGSRFFSKILRTTGIMASTLIDNLFSLENVSDNEKKLLYSVCQQKLIIAQLTQLPENIRIPKKLTIANTFWLIPSLFAKEGVSQELTLMEEKIQVGRKNEVLVTSRKILWAEVVPSCLFENFVCCLVNGGTTVGGLKLKHLSSKFLTATIRSVQFELKKSLTSTFLLNIYSTDISLVEEIMGLFKNTYEKICSLVHEDISNDPFFEEVLTHEEKEIYRQSVLNRRISKEVSHRVEWDCFLSHCWGQGQATHRRVLEIGQKLKASGLRVWVDHRNLNDNVESQILEGIDYSHVFIAFITQEYLTASNNANSNAGQEFRYGASKDVRVIVPVVLDPNLLNPSSWNNTVLKLKLATKLYIDFSSRNKEMENMESLIKRIKYVKKMIPIWERLTV